MRPPRGGHLDRNHREVVDGLRRAGILARSTAGHGDGFPDILAGFRGVLVLLEVKDGTKPPSGRKLTKDEAEFVATWPNVYVVSSAEEAIRVVVEAARGVGSGSEKAKP